MKQIMYIVMNPKKIRSEKGNEQYCFGALFSAIETARLQEGKVVFCGTKEHGAYLAKCEHFARMSSLVSFIATAETHSAQSQMKAALAMMQRKNLLLGLDEIHVFVEEDRICTLRTLQSEYAALNAGPCPIIGSRDPSRPVNNFRPQGVFTVVTTELEARV